MYYSQVDVKMTRRLPVLQGEKGPRIFHEYHDLSNDLFQEWSRQTLIFLAQKVLRRFEFTFYVASHNLDDIQSSVSEYVARFGGNIGKISIVPISEEIFVEGLKRARYMGYLRNGKGLCLQMENNTESKNGAVT